MHMTHDSHDVTVMQDLAADQILLVVLLRHHQSYHGTSIIHTLNRTVPSWKLDPTSWLS